MLRIGLLLAAAAVAAVLLGADVRDLARDDEEPERLSGTVTEVVDGDTIHVRAGGEDHTVRLIGIDTPETHRPGTGVECGGPEATSSLHRLAFRQARDTDGDGLLDDGSQGRRVVLRTDPSQDEYDRFDRLLAYVSTDGTTLQEEQLRAGWAEVYVYGGEPFRRVGAFRRAERSARAAGRGVWARCGGDFHSGG